jgi:hypothetical protein
MPRNVRNFWAEMNVDGRESELASGPRNKDGGMSIRIYQRNQGDAEQVLTVNCYVNYDGNLELNIYNRLRGETVFKHVTER